MKIQRGKDSISIKDSIYQFLPRKGIVLVILSQFPKRSLDCKEPAAFSIATGTPKITIMQSPINLSIVPPLCFLEKYEKGEFKKIQDIKNHFDEKHHYVAITVSLLNLEKKGLWKVITLNKIIDLIKACRLLIREEIT